MWSVAGWALRLGLSAAGAVTAGAACTPTLVTASDLAPTDDQISVDRPITSTAKASAATVRQRWQPGQHRQFPELTVTASPDFATRPDATGRPGPCGHGRRADRTRPAAGNGA